MRGGRFTAGPAPAQARNLLHTPHPISMGDTIGGPRTAPTAATRARVGAGAAGATRRDGAAAPACAAAGRRAARGGDGAAQTSRRGGPRRRRPWADLL